LWPHRRLGVDLSRIALTGARRRSIHGGWCRTTLGCAIAAASLCTVLMATRIPVGKLVRIAILFQTWMLGLLWGASRRRVLFRPFLCFYSLLRRDLRPTNLHQSETQRAQRN